MAAAQYTGVNGVARKVKSQFIGVNGVARKVKNGFIGVNGVARKCFGGETVTISGTGASWGRTIPAGAAVSGSVVLDVTFEIVIGNTVRNCNFSKNIQFTEVALPHSFSCDSSCFDMSFVDIESNSEATVILDGTGISANFYVEYFFDGNDGHKHSSLEDATITKNISWTITYIA